MKILRDEALTIIAYKELTQLTDEERENILIDIFSDGDDYENIQEYNSPKHNKEIITFIKLNYQGVKNTYISNKINEIFKVEVSIVGNIEDLKACPCCSYKTLSTRGQYDICKICFWEDDSINSDLNRHSNVNRMTIKKAKENFNKIGVISENYLKFVDAEAKFKYLLLE